MLRSARYHSLQSASEFGQHSLGSISLTHGADDLDARGRSPMCRQSSRPSLGGEAGGHSLGFISLISSAERRRARGNRRAGHLPERHRRDASSDIRSNCDPGMETFARSLMRSFDTVSGFAQTPQDEAPTNEPSDKLWALSNRMPHRLIEGLRTMQVPSILLGESRTRLLQGIAIGAIASMVIGFSWGG